jgi:1-phosphofructokinase
MIYTVTINPSLDYIVTVPEFRTGIVNRTAAEKINAGGKGINVSLVLHNLGIQSVALGFTAGFTGRQIITLLEEKGLKTDFIPVSQGISRINVKLRASEETEINGQGPDLSKSDLDHLFQKIDQLQEHDILVLAGSIPAHIPETLYMDIMSRLQNKNIRIVVDATKDLLKKALPFHPFLVKPNNHELGELFGQSLKTKEEVIPCAQKLQEMGAQNVLVSMAGTGAVLIAADGKIRQSTAPAGKKVNSVGAGDSMVAGFLAGFLQNNDYTQAFLTGLCTGTASACSEELAKKEQVEQLLKLHQFDFQIA